MTKKEKNQVIILSLLLLVILGVVGYMNRESFLPKITAGVTYGGIPKQTIPRASYGDLFERPDFQALSGFGDVPIKVRDTKPVPNPFKPFEE